MAECHFTVAGFVQPRDLPRCEALGLKAIVAPQRRPRYLGQEFLESSDAEIDARVQAMVEAVRETAGESPAVLGYFLMDEPGAAVFPQLAKAVAAVKRYAPGKLAYVNLYPNYATIAQLEEGQPARDKSQLQTARYAEYLERFVAEVRPQFLSYDNYMVLYADDLREPARSARYFTNLLEVRRVALQHRLPWWQVVSSNQIRPHTPIPSPANLQLQAYTTLAAGGRGVSWFTYYATGYGYAPVDQEGRRTATWFALQYVNRQLKALGPVMSGLRSTGVYFSPPVLDEALPLLPGAQVQRVETEGVEAQVMVGEFLDNSGGTYVMVVNLSLERSVKVRVELRGERQIAAVASVDDGRFVPVEAGGGLWLTAGQGALLRLT